ncbi:Remorin family protein putative isoform 1 [Tripterygium wilfordii]|uniref:Remorin family protein putative isoform 1 n=1 Tax=Tripterygium wilfordii TaxID=458696 RepID=A0A7J7CQ15_TRIWF|nr:Remorin family protein putative isoform 1 [Tripterygium wilfordii]
MDGNKGWSSERVPLHSGGSSRRQISAATLTPFYTGRTMPSKWDDAERWICSPVSGYSAAKNLNFQSQRLQKSKSGPIVPPGIGYYSNSSPVMQVLDGHRVGSFVVAESPFSTGVIVPGGVPLHYRGLVGNDNSFAQSAAPTRWADLASESSLPSSQDEKVDDMKDAETMVSRVVSRRDMANQMSPNNTSSSPRVRSSSPPTILPDDHPARMEIREVQVDKQATIISSPERRGPYAPKKGFPDVVDFNRNAPCACVSTWETSETATNVSKLVLCNS